MDQEKFGALVARLEEYAREHPGGYKLRVGLLAALGYVYLFAVVALLLGVVAAVLAYVRVNWLVIKILWIPLVLVGVVLRSLWVKFPEPEGLRLKYEDAPALFDLVKEVESRVQSPHVHHVLLTDDFNAAVVQIPRLGVFGWQKNFLLVGLPLMRALTPDEFRAVIAHEMGHLSGDHSRFAGWIYRVRETWIQIVVRLRQQERHGAFVFERFLNWYAPFFNAYSFVLARAQEYEADAHAVGLAGRENAARALVNLEIKGRFLAEDFWPGFYRQADAQAEPPPDVFTQFVAATKREVPADAARRWFMQVLSVQTGYEDTHPSLADRLAAIGYPAPSADAAENQTRLLRGPDAAGPDAAHHYLGRVADEFTSSRDGWWREQVGQPWRDRYREVQQARKRIRELQEKELTRPLTAGELWELVKCLLETGGFEAALPKMRELLDAEPDHVGANFLFGQALLEQNDEAGVAHVEKAMARDADAVLPGCQIIYFFLRERGRDEEAEQYRLRAERHYAEAAAAK